MQPAPAPLPNPVPVPPAPLPMQALCGKCNRLMPLEVCFECNQPLCRSCVVNHFESWKYQKGPQCFEAQTNIQACKDKVEGFSPFINKNLDYVNQLKAQINKAYSDALEKVRIK